MQRQRRRAVAIAGADRPADRGGNAAAHRARRHHLRQHHEGKHQRDAGERLGAEPADIGGLGDRNQRRADHGDRIGQRELQQRRQDRRGEQAVDRRGRNRGGGRMSSGASMVMRHRSSKSNKLWMTYYPAGAAQATRAPRRGHHGRPHRSIIPSRGLRVKSNTIWRHRLEANSSTGLLGIDLALERMPAARLVERLIVRLAEQHRKAHRLVVAHGPDRGVQRQRGIAAPPAICPRRNAADAADLDLAPVPDGVAEVDADMAGKTRLGPRPPVRQSARANRRGPI